MAKKQQQNGGADAGPVPAPASNPVLSAFAVGSPAQQEPIKVSGGRKSRRYRRHRVVKRSSSSSRRSSKSRHQTRRLLPKMFIW